jgi:uncharacterized protein YcfJ
MSSLDAEGAREIMDDYKKEGASGHGAAIASGALLGGSLGLIPKNKKAAVALGVAGAAGGGYVGHKLGKSYEKAKVAEGKRRVKIYKDSSPAERAELRRRRYEEAKLREMRKQTAAQQQMAWNSWQ